MQPLEEAMELTLTRPAQVTPALSGVSAVILDVASRASLLPLSRHRAIHQFPVFGRPLLGCIIQALTAAGVDRVAFASGAPPPLDPSSWDSPGMLVRLVRECSESGSAGVLRELDEWLEQRTCLVLTADVFVTAEDLGRLIQTHLERNAWITALVAGESQPGLEGARVDPDGRVLGFYGLHASRERRQQLKPLGVYAVSPAARRAIPESGYYDLREQLVPALLQSQAEVFACLASLGAHRLNTLADYRALFRQAYTSIELGSLDLGRFLGPTYKAVAPGVWSEGRESIADDVHIVGPVVLGRDCCLEPGAQLVGPVALEAGCTVHSGALVRDTIIWEGASVGRDARVVGCLLAPGVVVPPKSYELFKVVPGEPHPADLPHYLAWEAPLTHVPAPFGASTRRYLLYLASKRAMDLALAGFGLLACVPVWVVIALAIKLDSTGPVLYRQRRCGLGGREFQMLKFRTMRVGADAEQAMLATRNDVDGPVFKIQHDPRVTRVGKLLRKTSLDELPQLVNVLVGHMSLVGPRPLVMEEMRFPKRWRDARLTVKPGMTGLWQVEGRGGKAFHYWVSNDLAYVESRSLRLDLRILLHTFTTIFTAGRRNGLSARTQLRTPPRAPD